MTAYSSSRINFTRRSGRTWGHVMKSVVIKRSGLINGRKTSVSLENEFWTALHEIAQDDMSSLSTIVEQIDKSRDNINLSSAIRVFVFNHFWRLARGRPAAQVTHNRVANGTKLRARAEECRLLAETMRDNWTRAIVLRLASGYDLLGNGLESAARPHEESEYPSTVDS
jgi:predicted DNA-binding ribbon-helix-helix protein